MAASSTPPLPGLRFRFHRDFRIRSDATAWGCANAGTKDAPTKRPVETHLSGAIKHAATENDATGCDCFVSFLPPLSLPLCSVALSLLQPPRLDNNEGEAVQIRATTVHWPRRISSNWIVYELSIVRERIYFWNVYFVINIVLWNVSTFCLKLKGCGKEQFSFQLKFFNCTVKLSIR